ncbi:uncharacterized protein [Aquarana catesbeiana]|uniref:uncharacterized protein isoform X1 n=2 Tax=Aquarana catesbeiana TaxID=8400 RepID=UPI003CCA4C87
MVKEREQLAEAILNHALEIICLLTVEDFIVVKRPDGTRFSIRATEINSNECDPTSGYPELFFTLLGMEDKTQRTIVEMANKIIQLLTREAFVKCEDVAVSFSKDEWEYPEGHGEQSKNSQDTSTIDQPTSPVQLSTEKIYPINLCIKEEPEEEPPHITDGASALPSSEFISRSPERKPLSSVNVHLPFMETQSVSAYNFIPSCDIKPEAGGESSDDTIDSVDAESPQFPHSSNGEQVYNSIEYIEEEPEESKDSYASVSEDRSSPGCMYKDEDYLPLNANYTRARKHKSKSGKMSPPCEVCGKVFGSKSSLERHLQIHTGQRPFPCNECGKRFSCRNHLNTHKRSHSGERPFSCNQCGRRFINHQHLVLHQVVHTGEKPYSCPVCGKGFTRQSSVVKHSGMHAEQKPFVCNECGKSYCQYASLVVHQRQHSGEKPFVCKYCDKAFTCKATMLKHQKAHTGEKPFPCPQCDRCFIDNATLSKHKRKVHADEPNQPSRLGLESV